MSLSSEESPWWAWFAHHQFALVAAGITLNAVGVIVRDVATVLAGSVFLVGFMIGNSAVRRHVGILCSRCIDSAPTNAAVLVARRDWALRLHHWIDTHPGRQLLALFALLAVGVATGLPTAVFVMWPWLGLEAWVARFHRRVIPWCPYCRGDDWGHHEHAPDSAPAGTRRA